MIGIFVCKVALHLHGCNLAYETNHLITKIPEKLSAIIILQKLVTYNEDANSCVKIHL